MVDKTTGGILLLLAAMLLINLPTASAQPQCGFAETISYPIDTNTFQLVQDYGVASVRHQGRYHTGEDWFAGRSATLGQPVRAVAAGRVTYANNIAWGRDGGVVIIEHTLPDGSIFYSQYGHVVESDSVTLPARLSCVDSGQVIGVVADARPAPHLHFEMRTNNPDVPGPGYTRELPDTLGWRRPAQVITNLQAQLTSSHRWNFSSAGFRLVAPPLVIGDHSLIFLSENYLRRITPDGRVLWRAALDTPAISVERHQLETMVVFVDGRINRVSVEDGAVLETWRLPFAPTGAPLMLDSMPLYPTADGYVMLSRDRRTILQEGIDLPDFARALVTERMIALVVQPDIHQYELWLFRREGEGIGEVISRAELRAMPHLSTAPDGMLIIYSQGGLWRVDTNGQWAAAIEAELPPDGPGSAVIAPDGRIFVTDGQVLHAYTRTGEAAWQARLPRTISGPAHMEMIGTVLLITSQRGDVIAVRDAGGICGFTRVYGTDRGLWWHHLGDDGVLRLGIETHLFGFNWDQFTNRCG